MHVLVQALIYPPSRTASQQGNAQSAGGQRAAWKLMFDLKPKWVPLAAAACTHASNSGNTITAEVASL